MDNALQLDRVAAAVTPRISQAGPWNKYTPKRDPYANWIDWCPKCGGDLYVTAATLEENNQRLIDMRVPVRPDGFDFSDCLPDEASDWATTSTKDEVVTCESCGQDFKTDELLVEDHPKRKPHFAQMHTPTPPPPAAIVQQAPAPATNQIFTAPANWNRPASLDDIVEAIGRAENDGKYGVKSIKPPAGTKDIHEWARGICRNTVRNNFARWKSAGAQGDFIAYLGGIYAPTKNATNDPHSLNANWVKNVRYFIQHGQ